MLVTLAVIGIIAILAVSALIQNSKEKEYVERLKKAYSILSQAVNMYTFYNGKSPDEWGITSNNVIIDNILPYLQYTKVCRNGEICHHAGNFLMKNKGKFMNPFKTRPTVILNDGMILSGYISGSCTYDVKINNVIKKICGEYTFDVNGEKGPNRYGTDLFMFILTEDGVFPAGAQEKNSQYWDYSFETGCLSSDAKGAGCSGWVITHSNLDYLHCPDKIRKGQTSCSGK